MTFFSFLFHSASIFALYSQYKFHSSLSAAQDGLDGWAALHFQAASSATRGAITQSRVGEQQHDPRRLSREATRYVFILRRCILGWRAWESLTLFIFLFASDQCRYFAQMQTLVFAYLCRLVACRFNRRLCQ